MWRPKDWESRLDKIDPELMRHEKSRELVEAGADAMLKTLLRKYRLDTPSLNMAIHHEYRIELYGRNPSPPWKHPPWMLCESMDIIKTKGRLVFIPEED